MSKYVTVATNLDGDDSIYIVCSNPELAQIRDAINEKIEEAHGREWMSKSVEVSRYFHNEYWTRIRTKYEEKMSVKNVDLIDLRDALNERIEWLGIEEPNPVWNSESVTESEQAMSEIIRGSHNPSCAPSRESVESVAVEGVVTEAGGDERIVEVYFSDGTRILKYQSDGMWYFECPNIARRTNMREYMPQYAIDEIERIEREEAEREANVFKKAELDSVESIAALHYESMLMKEAVKEIRGVIESHAFYGWKRDWSVNLDGGDAS